MPQAAGTLADVAIAIVLFIVVPIVELYLFIQVSNAIGFLNALGLVVLISLIGVAVKRAGTRMWARFNEQVVAQSEPTKDVADGVRLSAPGFCSCPGFLTDALGLLLLLPPSALAARARPSLLRTFQARVIKATYGPSESGTTGTVIGGTIVGGTVIDTEGVERLTAAAGTVGDLGAARPGDDPAAGHPGSAKLDGDFDLRAVRVRDAATVMLIRDGVGGVEVFMLRRTLSAAFASGMYVFPGGAVDAADRSADAGLPRRPHRR